MSNYAVDSPRAAPRPTPIRPVPNTGGDIEALHRHDRYYFDDGVVFLVQNILFKIPRYMLKMESPVFEGMFHIPSCGQPEGDTDTEPVRLIQVEVLDFERLLELLSPVSYTKFTTGTNNWGEPDWTSILHLASLWQMGDIRSLAIAQLSSCAAPTSKISLGRKYDHPPWVRDGFLQLCLRDEPLAMKEAEELSLKEAVGIAEARERMRSHVIRSSCEHRWNDNGESYKTTYYTEGLYHSVQIHRILDEMFDLQDLFPETRTCSPS